MADPRIGKLQRPWTPEEDQHLRLMYETKTPVTEIAKQLDRSYSAVINRRPLIGVSVKVKRSRCDMWTKEEDRRLSSLWKQGMAMKQMGFELGRTKDAIRKRGRFLNLPKHRTGDKVMNVNVSLSEQHYSFIKKRANERRQTVSAYLRMLVVRDHGFA